MRECGLEMIRKSIFLVCVTFLLSTVLGVHIIAPVSGIEGITENFNFIAYGDTRSWELPDAVSPLHEEIVNAYLQHDPDLIIHTGDMVRAGGLWYQWIAFNESIAAVREAGIPFYGVVGNHEKYTDQLYVYDEEFINYRTYFDFTHVLDESGENELYHSFNYKGVHFVFLNTEDYFDERRDGSNEFNCSAAQMNWLLADLSKTHPNDFIVVSLHRTAWSIREDRPDRWWQAETVRDDFHDIFVQNGVDLVLMGHDHCYYHTIRDGIHYVTTAGGGAPLAGIDPDPPIWQEGDTAYSVYHYCHVEVDRTHITVTALTSDDIALESFTIAHSIITEPVYLEIVDYYDNRRAVVTVTADDWINSTWQQFEAMGQMLSGKQVYYTGAIITDFCNWTHIQYWLNNGYAEAASHGRTHPSTPYSDYDSEINGSKQDILTNLILPPNFSYGSAEYVYTWIEPWGDSDSTVRQKLGECKYLADRRVGLDDGWAIWDSANGLFDRIGFSMRMESPSNGGVDNATALNNKFDSVYGAGGIYHLMTHPRNVNWEPGQYADLHTSYISNRKDVWYVNFGLLHLYHWIDTQNVTQVTSTGSLQDKVFKITISSTDHQNYGAKYPLTYVFDIPPSWTNAYVNYRFQEAEPWTTMETKTSSDFFNGVNAARFDFSNHKAYVSIGFNDKSNDIYLQILPQDSEPTANFAASPTSGLEPLTVTFTDTSTSYDGITDWEWDFGDGETSTQQDPSHTYTQDGEYTVRLTVYEGDGDSATETKVDYITVADTVPTAVFFATPTSGDEPLTVSFTDTSTSYDGITDWEWDFGDGETSTEQNPSHTYASGGLYTVSLTVSDTDGDNNSETKSDYIVVGDSVPTASFTYSPSNPVEGDLITFDASGSTGYDKPLSYGWDFGDGASGVGVTPTHTYAQDGPYLVTLTVTDVDGSANSTYQTITVADRAPVADFNASPTSGIEHLQINFEDTSTSYDGIIGWTWNFGDGQSSKEQNPTHAYEQDGAYTVSLTVVEGDGSYDMETKTQYITVADTVPTADFSYSPSPAALTIDFIDQSTSHDELVSWFWDFGDGQTSTKQNPNHTFPDDGTFNVDLTVTDADGSTDSTTKQVSVMNTAPTADFKIVSSPKPAIDEEITFLDQSSDLDGSIVFWFWDLGDRTTSTSQNVTHRYHTLGTFLVTLTVIDDDDEIDTISKSVTIYDVVPPVTVDDYDGLWHTSDFTINLTATDDLSGVQTIYYIINDGPVMNVQTHGQPRISVEGRNKLQYWSVDFYENEETHHVIYNIKLDKTSRRRAIWIVCGIILAIVTASCVGLWRFLNKRSLLRNRQKKERKHKLVARRHQKKRRTRLTCLKHIILAVTLLPLFITNALVH